MPLFIYSRQITATQNDAALYHSLLRLIDSSGSNNAFVCALLSFFLLYVQALMINYLVNEFRLLPKHTYLPAMSYLLLTSLLPAWNYLSAPLVAATFIIWIISKLFRLYNVAIARVTVYNIGLLAGISSYIYFPSAAFIICIVLGLIILKPFRLNEVVLFILGFITPYYFFGAYLFLTGGFRFASFLPRVAFAIPQVKSTIWLAISTVLLAVPFLSGGYFVQLHLHKMLIQVRKAWSILLIYLLVAFFVPFINSSPAFTNWIVIAAPFACFHASTYYHPEKKWLPNVLFFLTTGFVLYQQYGTTLWLP